jgi:ParB family chromosome partitioning protein
MRSRSHCAQTENRKDSPQETQIKGEAMERTPNAHENEYRNIAVAQLQESPTNPRKRFNETSLHELAASFKAQGVLAPLVVRPLSHQERQGE